MYLIKVELMEMTVSVQNDSIEYDFICYAIRNCMEFDNINLSARWQLAAALFRLANVRSCDSNFFDY